MKQSASVAYEELCAIAPTYEDPKHKLPIVKYDILALTIIEMGYYFGNLLQSKNFKRSIATIEGLQENEVFKRARELRNIRRHFDTRGDNIFSSNAGSLSSMIFFYPLAKGEVPGRFVGTCGPTKIGKLNSLREEYVLQDEWENRFQVVYRAFGRAVNLTLLHDCITENIRRLVETHIDLLEKQGAAYSAQEIRKLTSGHDTNTTFSFTLVRHDEV